MSGLGSELGHGYVLTSLEMRFASLRADMQEKHGISLSVCLYSPADASVLAARCRLDIVRPWVSPFGNGKIGAQHGGGGTHPGSGRLHFR